MRTRDAESVLVTGASGFIGQHLVRRLIERGDRVSCLVRATSRIDELRSSGAQLIVGDATDRAGIERALAESQASVVFHLAGSGEGGADGRFRTRERWRRRIRRGCLCRPRRAAGVDRGVLAGRGGALRRRPTSRGRRFAGTRFRLRSQQTGGRAGRGQVCRRQCRSLSCVRRSSSAPATEACWKCSGRSRDGAFTSCPAGASDDSR